MLRAMETKKMSRLWASATRAFQTPSGEMGAPPKLQSLSTRIFWATHATSFIGSALYASASSFETAFLKNPL